jgi:ABC-type multidrug transport system fused ATPase/permease subunit
MKQNILRLAHYLRPYQWNIVFNVICNILTVLFSIISIPMLIPFLQILLGIEVPPAAKPTFAWNIAALVKTFYYELGQIIVQFGKERALIYVCSGISLVFFFKNLFKYLSLYFITPLRNGIVRDIRQELFEKTLRLPLSYFSDERKGDLLSRIATDVQEVEWSILNVLERFIREPLTIIGSIFVMLQLSTPLTGFVLILILITGVVIGGIGRTLKKESTELQGKLGELIAVLEEALGGLRVIKGFNAESYQYKKFGIVNNSFRNLLTKILRRRDLSSPLTEFLGVSVVCVLVWYGFKRVSAGDLDGAGFIAFLYAFFTVIEPSKAIAEAYYYIQKGLAAVDRVDKILMAKETITDPLNPIELTSFEQKIEYQSVGFNYKTGEKQVLKNISFEIPKGQIVALVGASGAGKSTIADLLPRFYDCTEGNILIDGKKIQQVKIAALRNLMGIVTQDAVLFNDTIYNNIVFGLQNVQPDDVTRAAKSANAYDFIMATEQGFQTNIGDRGMKLSGGQRQRLTIARALLKNPAILILDEATSALDSEAEKAVQAALNELMRERTALVIAHRLSTVQHAHQILVLNQGEIVERGTHEQLLERKGTYFKLVQMQGLKN